MPRRIEIVQIHHAISRSSQISATPLLNPALLPCILVIKGSVLYDVLVEVFEQLIEQDPDEIFEVERLWPFEVLHDVLSGSSCARTTCARVLLCVSGGERLLGLP